MAFSRAPRTFWNWGAASNSGKIFAEGAVTQHPVVPQALGGWGAAAVQQNEFYTEHQRPEFFLFFFSITIYIWYDFIIVAGVPHSG